MYLSHSLTFNLKIVGWSQSQKRKNVEQILRRTVVRDGTRYMILRFQFPDRKVVLDKEISGAMKALGLRPVTEGDRAAFSIKECQYRYPIVIFGTEKRGSSDSGGFTGYECWDENGKIDLIPHWTRGQNGDEWNTDIEFLFVVGKKKTP